MHMSTAVPSLFVTILALPLVFAQHDAIHAKKNHAHRRVGELAALEKRTDNALFTYYDISTGETACGGYYSNSDYVVALNSDQYTDGNHCGEQIIITVGSSTATASIADECPSCSYGQLDLTEGLFEFFAPTASGTVYGSWIYATDASSSSSTPSPTPSYTPPPSSSSAPPSSTWTPPPSSSSSTSSSSSPPPSSPPTLSPSSNASSSSTSSSSSSSMAPTSTAPPTTSSNTPSTTPSGTSFAPGNLNQFNLALIGLTDVVVEVMNLQ